MKRDLKELIHELLDHIDENPLSDEQLEKIEKWIEENRKER
ncbi:colicin immunity protein [Streptococcus lutetiensis]|nr:colicin immunity protein [Streptococcus lutetiensis]MBT0902851.1 colicin immunity protein [Streptococcus lutetiensis]MBT0922248.1 colicin immunity protein [Streptococcus lutetiensis]MBT0946912.1 colicin immunity protein [Streptococcus lutetiensis]